MENIILCAVLIGIVLCVIAYIYKKKKAGTAACIGCPYAGECKGKCETGGNKI